MYQSAIPLIGTLLDIFCSNQFRKEGKVLILLYISALSKVDVNAKYEKTKHANQ